MISLAQPVARRRARDLARAATALAAVMLGLTSVKAFDAAALPAGTAPIGGQALSVQSGSTATTFNVSFAAGANSCPGDSATGGYRWNSYMVPSSVDPATLTYGTSGPIAQTAGTFTQPLYSSGNAPLVNKNTAPDTAIVIGVGVVSFSAYQFLPGGVPNGTYRFGIACTKDGQTERFWQSQVTFTGEPTAFTWTVEASAATTTTTTVAGATTTSVAGASTTTVGGATTTTTVRASTTTSTSVSAATTTTAGSTTTTLLASAAPTSTLASSFASTGFSTSSGSGSGGGSGSAIPVTGPSHTVSIVFWALLLLAFGRMAVLLARPIRVLPPDAR